MRLVKPSSFSYVATLLLVGSSAFLIGCQNTVTTSSFYGSTGWGSTEETSVPGITCANLKWYRRGENLIYVVWTDLHHSGTGGGSSGTTASGTHQHDSDFVNFGGEQLFAYHYKGRVNDGNSMSPGTITINKNAYELKDGKLLLVSTRGDQPQVKQLDLDDSSIHLLQDESPEHDITAHFRSMANENADIRSFFDSASGQ